MKLLDRANVAVISKLDKCLDDLQSQINDVGIVGIDLALLKADIEARLREKYSVDTEPSEDNHIILFGTDEDHSPMPLARSLTCQCLRKWLADLSELIASVEKAEDEKIKLWVTRKIGKGNNIDLQELSVVKIDEKFSVIKVLGIIHQVLSYETERLKTIVGKMSDNVDGMAAFVRDLALARMSDSRVEQVLFQLMDVTETKVIDEVLESSLLKSNEHYQVIAFMGQTLKQRIELGIDDEAWKTNEETTMHH